MRIMLVFTDNLKKVVSVFLCVFWIGETSKGETGKQENILACFYRLEESKNKVANLTCKY